MDEPLSGYPGGICLRGCGDTACPEGHTCEELEAGNVATRACLPLCATSADCRPGYLCDRWVKAAGGTFVEIPVCMPHCSSGADCTTTDVCDPYYGLCGTQPHPGAGEVGMPCSQHEDCRSDFCMSGRGYPDGYCTASCSLLTPDCPAGSACEDRLTSGGDVGVCLASCSGDADCRPGYACVAGDFGGTPVCSSSITELDVVRSGAGTGMVSGHGIDCGTDCYEVVAQRRAITLTAVADAGSTFTGWYGCEAESGATCTMSLQTSEMVVAFFEPAAVPAILTVTRSGSGSGMVSGDGVSCGSDCSHTVASGTRVTLRAMPATGASFAGWSGCDSASGDSCVATATTNRTVTAAFGGYCTPGTTRCVRDNIGLQERCSAAGSWTQESCGSWRLCAADACRAACGMTAPPAEPTLCLLPIADGVNDGEWAYAPDPQLRYGTYAYARTRPRLGDHAEIRPATGEQWPYLWRLRASDFAIAAFRLDQFGSYRHPAFGYRVRKAGVHASPATAIVGVIGGDSAIGGCASSASPGWAAGSCLVATPYNQSFDYSGGFNSMSLLTRRTSGLLDLIEVNYAYLSIAP